MYLIDDSYFTGKINIPNGSTEYNGSTIEPIDDYINKYGRMFMRETLGNVLFKDLNENLTDGELNTNATAKWKNLINGTEYVKNGTTYTWQGIKGGCDLYKDSVLAYFVYLNYFEIHLNFGFVFHSIVLDNLLFFLEIWFH